MFLSGSHPILPSRDGERSAPNSFPDGSAQIESTCNQQILDFAPLRVTYEIVGPDRHRPHATNLPLP